MDGELDFQNVNNQIQPYLFEALASGHYSSDNYFRESESASDNGDHSVNQEQIGQVDWWAFDYYDYGPKPSANLHKRLGCFSKRTEISGQRK